MRTVASGKPGTPPWMLLRLALETGPHHSAADEDRLDGLHITRTAEYRRFMQRVHGFEAPVENAAVKILGQDSELAREHCYTRRLHDDLLKLGLDARSIEVLPSAAPVLRTSADAYGWMFVLVRNRLIAGQLSRHVSRTLGHSVVGSTSYLDASSDKPGLRLRMFGDMLCAAALKLPAASIVAAANEAFRAQRLWYAGAPSIASAHAAGDDEVAFARSDTVEMIPMVPLQE